MPLSVVVNQNYSDVTEFMKCKLRDHRERLTFMPGDSTIKVIQIIAAPLKPEDDTPSILDDQPSLPTHEIQSVQLDGVELLSVTTEGDQRPWMGVYGSKFFSPDRIRDRISDDLAIPKWALQIKTEPPMSSDVFLAVPENHGIKTTLALKHL